VSQAEPTVAVIRPAGSDYRRGALLVGGAALAWSTAGLLVRWTGTDPWTTLFWRALFAGIALVAFLIATEGRRSARAILGLGPVGIGLAACLALSMVTFINALDRTTVANVVVFQAASPLFAALLARVWLGERIAPRVALAIGASLIGVVVMVSSRFGVTDPAHELVGDLIALVMSLASALVNVLARLDRRVAIAGATCVAMLMTAALALPFADLAPSGTDLTLLAVFGLGQMALPLVLFTGGVRLIPAADAALVSIIECVVAPLWVWLAFRETPDRQTLLGGAIVLAAVFYAARHPGARRGVARAQDRRGS
jgi:drug/metabolite transporter (DMT)-like permease